MVVRCMLSLWQRAPPGPQQKRSIAALCVESARTLKSKWHSSAALMPSSHALGPCGSVASARAHMSHVIARSCSWSRWRCSSVAKAVADVRSTQKAFGHGSPLGGPTHARCGLSKAATNARL